MQRVLGGGEGQVTRARRRQSIGACDAAASRRAEKRIGITPQELSHRASAQVRQAVHASVDLHCAKRRFAGAKREQRSLSLRRPPVAALHRRRRSGPAAGHPSDSPAGPNSFRHWFPAERLSGRSFSRPNRTDPSYRRATISAQRVYAGSDSHRREVSARAAAIARACWASVEVASAPVAPARHQVQGITRGRGRGASGCRCGISNGNGRDP